MPIIKWRTGLVGGTESDLDGIEIAGLSANDRALVISSDRADTWRWDPYSSTAPDGFSVIKPDLTVNPGLVDGRWHLVHAALMAVDMIKALLLANPGYTFTVTGNAVYGSSPPVPDAVTQTYVDWLTDSCGVPSRNILWNVTPPTLLTKSMSVSTYFTHLNMIIPGQIVPSNYVLQSAIEQFALSQIGGVFNINEISLPVGADEFTITRVYLNLYPDSMESGSIVEAISIALAGGQLDIEDVAVAITSQEIDLNSAGILTIRDAFSNSLSANVTLSLGGGLIDVSSMVLAPTMAGDLAMVFAGGTMSLANLVSNSDVENVVLISGGGVFTAAELASWVTIDEITITEVVAGAFEGFEACDAGQILAAGKVGDYTTAWPVDACRPPYIISSDMRTGARAAKIDGDYYGNNKGGVALGPLTLSSGTIRIYVKHYAAYGGNATLYAYRNSTKSITSGTQLDTITLSSGGAYEAFDIAHSGFTNEYLVFYCNYADTWHMDIDDIDFEYA